MDRAKVRLTLRRRECWVVVMGVGFVGGLTLRTRWAMLLLPLLYMAVVELTRLNAVGPTVDALRLAGRTVLQGYRNQVFATSGGVADPRLSRDAGLGRAVVLGGCAVAITQVRAAGWGRWQRGLALLPGGLAVFADALQAPEDTHDRGAAQDVEVRLHWEAAEVWQAPPQPGVLSLVGSAGATATVPGSGMGAPATPMSSFSSTAPASTTWRGCAWRMAAKQDSSTGWRVTAKIRCD